MDRLPVVLPSWDAFAAELTRLIFGALRTALTPGLPLALTITSILIVTSAFCSTYGRDENQI